MEMNTVKYKDDDCVAKECRLCSIRMMMMCDENERMTEVELNKEGDEENYWQMARRPQGEDEGDELYDQVVGQVDDD